MHDVLSSLSRGAAWSVLVLLAACGVGEATTRVALVAPDIDVPAGTERFPCVVARSPFAADDGAVTFSPILTEPRVLHHLLLYGTETEIAEGVHEECPLPADAQLLWVWSPGAAVVEMPPDVALDLGDGTAQSRIILALHYVNATDATVRDRSGVEVALADPPRPNTAGVLVLGTSRVSIPPRVEHHEVVARCTARGDTPIVVVASSPHMHALGRALHTDVLRDDAILRAFGVDRFDDGSQQTWPVDPPVEVRPGDVLSTTCVYDNPSADEVRYGVGLDDEMCFHYLVAHPAEALPRSRICY